MPANSQEIVQQVRDEFEAILTFVLKASSQTVPDADTMERGLLRRLFELGCLLLRLYFAQQDQRIAPETTPDTQGGPLPYHSRKERVYLSVFGAVRFARRYYYRAGEGKFPLDAALNLPVCGASDLLREWREKLCAYGPYHQAEDWLSALLGHRASTRQMQQDIQADAALVADYYQEAACPQPDPEAVILVAQADGKGVPLRKSLPAAEKIRKSKGEKSACKKEAIVSSVYTLVPTPRAPKEVIASLFEKEPSPATRAAPVNKQVFATLEGKEAALRFTAQQVWKQEGSHIVHRVALTDGSDALQQKMQAQFPEFTLVLDCIHAIEYLWKAANALLGETAPERNAWVKERALLLLSGRAETLIDDLRQTAARADCGAQTGKTLLSVATYYERNLPFMCYDRYLAAGWPIATGVIEGACRHLVKDRCELSGMRWTQPGAEALLQLRCVAENGDWEAFHAFRRAQRHIQLYGKAQPSAAPAELRLAA